MSLERCNHKTPLLRDGTSQRQRLHEALDPEYFLVDEKDVSQLLEFARKYAARLQYWDESNTRNEDWVSFIENDLASLCSIILNNHVEGVRLKYRSLLEDLIGTELIPISATTSNFKILLQYILEKAEDIDTWLSKSYGTLLHQDIIKVIESQAAPAIKLLHGYDKGADQQMDSGDGTTTFSDNSYDFGYTIGADTFLWNIDADADTSIFLGSSTDEVIKNAVPEITPIMEAILNVHRKLKEAAQKRLEETLSQYPEHAPHFGLYLAFIKMFNQAQNHLNEFTKRHLDFFYKDVLQLEVKEEISDTVHIILELAKNLDSHKVNKGTLLQAGKDKLGVPIYFQLDHDIVINKAKASSFKNIFIEKDETGVINIFKSEVANSEDGKGEPFEDNERWKLFGNKQNTSVNDAGELFTEETNMVFSEIGFAVASHQLLMKEGKRVTTLLFTLSENLPDSLNIDTDLLDVCVTGENGWIFPDIVIASTPIPTGETERKFLRVEITINPGQVPIVAYDPELHSHNFNTDIPVLKMVLKPRVLNSSTYLYDLFKDLKIEKVKISSRVEGILDILIQNDENVLSAEKPFYPFGTSPSKGSNFYIGSAEVFSKKLTGLDINIEWMDPPLDLEEHYAEYDLDFRKISGDEGVGTSGERLIRGGRRYARYRSGRYRYWRYFISRTIKRITDARRLKYSELGNTLFSAKLQILQNYQWSDLSRDLEYTSNPIDTDSEVIFRNYLGRWDPDPESTSNVLLHEWTRDRNNGNKLSMEAIHNKPVNAVPLFEPYRETLFEETPEGVRISHDPPQIDSSAATPRTIRVANADYVEMPIARDPNNAKVKTGQTFALLDNEFERDNGLRRLERYDANSKRGFVRLQLNNPTFQHKEYGTLLTNSVIEANKTNDPQGAPNPPYTPQIKSISLNYNCEYEIDFTENEDQFFHIYPFGSAQLHRNSDLKEDNVIIEDKIPLLPQFGHEGSSSTLIDPEGTLYIGIADLEPPQNLSLHFQFSEGTDNPELNVPNPKWSYLSNNAWKLFNPATEIIRDSTEGLVKSGVVVFDIPRSATNENTILPSGQYWIKVEVQNNTITLSDAIKISAQGVEASFIDQGNDPDRLRTNIFGGTISKFVEKDFAIKKVRQPFASFGGRIKEKDTEFYTRVSERLMHKHRAITIRDYERMVLEEFPELFKVKCVNHYRTGVEIAPGYVTVVVIPFPQSDYLQNPYELRVNKSKLKNIRDFLTPNLSQFVQDSLEVINPIYEQILLDFSVEFNPGEDRQFTEKRLNDDLKNFLSPWASGDLETISFGNSIDKSVVINFVEELPYVNYVKNFKMFHNGDLRQDVGIAIASTPVSILYTAPGHFIRDPETDEPSSVADTGIVRIISNTSS